MRTRKIKAFYTRKQVCFDGIRDKSYSQSPLKPYLLMKRIRETGYSDLLDVISDFQPFKKQDFKIAHTSNYVNNFFAGRGNYHSNGLPWSKNLVESVTYTNSSLYNAIKYAYKNPQTVTFAPVSGMHHARPTGGMGFCTFSGQVIASIKLYEQYKIRGAYLDLDGHFGNSIEDSRNFNPLVNYAIPEGFNFNPRGIDWEYVNEFNEMLTKLGQAIFSGYIHYVVFAHGADSHEWDDLGAGKMNTETWVACSQVFSEWVNEIEFFTGKHLPITLALFGGYRRDDYNSVLDLHIKSLIRISNTVCGNNFKDNLKITPKNEIQAV